jgi:dephospho-CoA kinase
MIVGICGFAGSGKDTIAKVFEEHGFRIMSFADILKDVVSLMYGLDRDLLSGKTTESRVWRE